MFKLKPEKIRKSAKQSSWDNFSQLKGQHIEIPLWERVCGVPMTTKESNERGSMINGGAGGRVSRSERQVRFSKAVRTCYLASLVGLP